MNGEGRNDVVLSAGSGPDADTFRRDVLAGLSDTPRHVPGKYLWDDAGLGLFDAITASPSYYPVHAETALLRQAAPSLAATVGPRSCIVEFGSGACHKVSVLLDAVAEPRRYVGIDIAEDFLAGALNQLRERHPRLDVVGIRADYLTGLPDLPLPRDGHVVGFFPGTSIGNMPPETAIRLLRRIKLALGPSLLLIGADPTIDAGRLMTAYGSPEMAAFHENLLGRMAREIGAELRADDFRHEARLERDPLRVEARLVARRDTAVAVASEVVRFRRGESIRTDVSWKYPPREFVGLAETAGWTPERHWDDRQGRFSLHLFRAR